jgi:hypothetical protein
VDVKDIIEDYYCTEFLVTTAIEESLILPPLRFEFPICFPEMLLLMFIVKRDSENLGHDKK